MGQPEASLSFAHFAKILILLFLLTPLTSFAHTNSAGRSGTGGGGGGGTGDITDVWGCATGNCNSITAASGDTLNATSATSSIPFTVNTTLPATCTVGQAHVKPDATAALKFFICTATNTWTEAAARIDFDTNLDGEIDTDKLTAPPGSPGQVVTIDGSDHLTLSSTLFSDSGGTVFSGSPLYVLDSAVGQFFEIDPDSNTPTTRVGLIMDGEPTTGAVYITIPAKTTANSGGTCTPGTPEYCRPVGTYRLMLREDHNSQTELETLISDNIIVDSEIDTIAKIEAIAAAINIITDIEINQMAELDALIADANVLSEEELNTQAETTASSIKFAPRPDAAPLDGEAVRFDPGLVPTYYPPVEDMASLESRDVADNYQIGAVVYNNNGNPNGSIACDAGSGWGHVSNPSELGRKFVWDTSTTPDQLWVCTTTGNSATSVWTLFADTGNTLTFTNKTISSADNVIKLPVKIPLEAASCSGTTGTLQWDTLATEAPTATCTAGTTNTAMMRGVADFANSGTFQMQRAFQLPTDFDASANLDAVIKWKTTATSGDVIWRIDTACSADGEADDVAWNTDAGTVTDAAKGSASLVNDASITNITKTGCAAGETLHIRIRRVPGGSDTISATASLMSVEFTYWKSM